MFVGYTSGAAMQAVKQLSKNNVFDKDYSLAAEGASGFKYQTPGRSLFTNLRYDF